MTTEGETGLALDAWEPHLRLRKASEGVRAGRPSLGVLLSHYGGDLRSLHFVRASALGALEEMTAWLATAASDPIAQGLLPFRHPTHQLRPGLLVVANGGPNVGFNRGEIKALGGLEEGAEESGDTDGSVEKAEREEASAIVLFFDFGFCLRVPVSALYPLPAALMKTPRLAHRLALFGWSEETFAVTSPESLDEFLHDFCETEDASLSLDLMGEDEEGLMTANLYREAGGGGGEALDLASELLRQGIVANSNCVVAPPRPQFPPSRRRLFVGNLFDGVTEKELYEHFGNYGRLRDWHIKRDSRGEPKLAFLTYSDEEALQAAMDAKPHRISGIKVYIKPADIRTEVDVEDDGPEVDAGPVRQMFVDHCGSLSEKDLRDYFSQYGHVTRCHRRHNRSFAFIDFRRPEEVDAVLAAGTGHAVPGTDVFLKVRKAQEKNRERVSEFEDYEELPWYVRGLPGPDGRGPPEGGQTSPTTAATNLLPTPPTANFSFASRIASGGGDGAAQAFPFPPGPFVQPRSNYRHTNYY